MEEKTSINWFPGHMKKTLNMFLNELNKVDLVIEILDARIPLSSKNPEVEKLVKNKTRIILLNKVDLVDKSKIAIWEKYFIERNLADYVLAMSVEKGFNLSSLRQIIDKLYNEKLEKMKKKGLIKTEIKAMVCGIPNVGKSKFINKIAAKSKAGVGNLPGFTRGKQWITVNKNFYLLDTPGVLWPKFENNKVATNLAITGSIKDDILKLEDISIALLEKMNDQNLLDNIFDYYKIEKKEYIKYHELLKDIEKRLKIHTTEYDYEKISKKILKDYRDAKLGNFFLEMPQ